MTAPDFRSFKPRTAPTAPAAADAVRLGAPAGGGPLPLVVEAAAPRLQAAEWVERERGRVDTLLAEHGALLFRGFAVDPADGFPRFAAAVGSGALPYTQRSTKRTLEKKGVYTSTEYPATHSIALHSENAFQYQWPQRIMFHSVIPAETGGATPIADNAAVFEAIDPAVREEFVRRGISYVRNFGAGLELPWQEAFQTERREEVEAYCAEHRIHWEWKDGDRLLTREVLPATLLLPSTRRRVWFNQVHLFHVSNLATDVRRALLEAMPEEDLPRHAYFGDGGVIPDAHLDDVRAAYAAETVAFPWRRDDILLVDNLRVCHGREPFTGDRKVLVSMSDPADYGQFAGASPVPSDEQGGRTV
ncbi:TauD/TfdA family dioxygenase [Streptomyces xylophagus]|uniref:TauD/TfdA family dioxygenase n=1 Tax=Streptomyces xylophagus TaxID=285514 RepID=UPI0006914530|nr:TauD/TfdA family dioxygenase [Streptomyces xylophagus]